MQMVYVPFSSNLRISSCGRLCSVAATLFMALPHLGPSFLKSGLMRFTSMPSEPSTVLISLTLTSAFIRSSTDLRFSLMFCTVVGIITWLRGWRTFMSAFFLSAKVSDVSFCASSICSSRRLFTIASLYLGNGARCTDSTLNLPLTALRSRNMRSA